MHWREIKKGQRADIINTLKKDQSSETIDRLHEKYKLRRAFIRSIINGGCPAIHRGKIRIEK